MSKSHAPNKQAMIATKKSKPINASTPEKHPPIGLDAQPPEDHGERDEYAGRAP